MYTDEINLHLGDVGRGPDEILIPLLARQLAVVFALAESGIIVNDLHSGNWKVIVADDGTLDPVIVDPGAACTYFEFGVIKAAWRLAVGHLPPGLGLSGYDGGEGVCLTQEGTWSPPKLPLMASLLLSLIQRMVMPL